MCLYIDQLQSPAKGQRYGTGMAFVIVAWLIFYPLAIFTLRLCLATRRYEDPTYRNRRLRELRGKVRAATGGAAACTATPFNSRDTTLVVPLPHVGCPQESNASQEDMLAGQSLPSGIAQAADNRKQLKVRTQAAEDAKQREDVEMARWKPGKARSPLSRVAATAAPAGNRKAWVDGEGRAVRGNAAGGT